MINNSVRSIYCHYDGYPEGVGQTLLNHYGEKELDKLLDLGGISSLKDTIESTALTAYREDVYVDVREDYFSNDGSMHIDYSYLYEDGKWIVYNHNTNEEHDLKKFLFGKNEINSEYYGSC
tara:strand:+ start:207 stop:569 length:363 start_codon:yes stop_codon:yes gene_type:complete